jgi:hypothetical protein
MQHYLLTPKDWEDVSLLGMSCALCATQELSKLAAFTEKGGWRLRMEVNVEPATKRLGSRDSSLSFLSGDAGGQHKLYPVELMRRTSEKLCLVFEYSQTVEEMR